MSDFYCTSGRNPPGLLGSPKPNFAALRQTRRNSLTMRWLMVAGCLWLGSGCSKSASEPNTAAEMAQTAAAAGDRSRCEHEGRDDRVVALSRGPGSPRPNTLRVYALGDDASGRRILRCREVDTNLDGRKDVIRFYDEEGKPVEEQADANYDGVFDTWVFFGKERVIRTELDNNADGKADEIKIFSGGKLSRLQRDTTFDGQTDTWEVYEKGRLSRIGVDSDADGRVDRWYRDEDVERRRLEAAARAEAAASEGQ